MDNYCNTCRYRLPADDRECEIFEIDDPHICENVHSDNFGKVVDEDDWCDEWMGYDVII